MALIAPLTLERDNLRDQLSEITATQLEPLIVERDILQEELKETTRQVGEMTEKMEEMKAEKMQSDAVIEQLTQQLAEANDKHNNQLSQIGLDHSASIAAQQEQHQQTIDDLVKEMEQIRHQHAAELQTLQNEHETKMQSLKTTMEQTQRNELVSTLAVATPDVNETPQPNPMTAVIEVAEQMTTNDALISVQEELEIAKNEIARLNELITASKVTEVIVVGMVTQLNLLTTSSHHPFSSSLSSWPLAIVSLFQYFSSSAFSFLFPSSSISNIY